MLSRTGVLILVTGGCLVSSFLLAAAVVPIPAMRGLGLQAAVLGVLNLAVAVLLFPALLALDLRRAAADKCDVACCYSGRRGARLVRTIKGWFGGGGPKHQDSKEMSAKTTKEERVSNLLHRSDERMPRSKKQKPIKTIDSALNETQEEEFKEEEKDASWLSKYGRWLTKPPVKLLVIAAHVALTVAGAWGAVARLEDGLSLDEVVPRETGVARFLSAQDAHFGFYNVYAVTMGNMEYPQSQALLYDYHKAFVGVSKIVKDDDGGLPEFWLPLFRAWLARLQGIFDDHAIEGRYKQEGWHENATAEGILAYKLMVQTGYVDYPVDVTLQYR